MTEVCATDRGAAAKKAFTVTGTAEIPATPAALAPVDVSDFLVTGLAAKTVLDGVTSMTITKWEAQIADNEDDWFVLKDQSGAAIAQLFNADGNLLFPLGTTIVSGISLDLRGVARLRPFLDSTGTVGASTSLSVWLVGMPRSWMVN